MILKYWDNALCVSPHRENIFYFAVFEVLDGFCMCVPGILNSENLSSASNFIVAFKNFSVTYL